MTPQFLTPLQVQPYADDRWFLVTPLQYVTLHTGTAWVIEIPAHVFPTDLASIPWIVQLVIRKDAKTHAAAVVHDWLTYRNNRFKRRGKDGITRSDADKIFREALIVAGVPAWKATTMYHAVRLFSWSMKR